jgi:3-phenylpropionate/cinnamic acid dioxygenase small subunit
LSTALAERDTEIHENLRVKANYESIQKRESRLQTIVETTRRELEDHQVRSRLILLALLLTNSSDVKQ